MSTGHAKETSKYHRLQSFSHVMGVGHPVSLKSITKLVIQGVLFTGPPLIWLSPRPNREEKNLVWDFIEIGS